MKQTVEDFWQGFAEQTGVSASYEAWGFGSIPEMADELAALVLEGKKTATASAVDCYEAGEELPKVGDYSIILSGQGEPLAVIQTKEVVITTFEKIDERQARLEGEGDLSLAYWRKVHEEFFREEYVRLGKDFSEQIPVCWERFEVVYPKK